MASSFWDTKIPFCQRQWTCWTSTGSRVLASCHQVLVLNFQVFDLLVYFQDNVFVMDKLRFMLLLINRWVLTRVRDSFVAMVSLNKRSMSSSCWEVSPLHWASSRQIVRQIHSLIIDNLQPEGICKTKYSIFNKRLRKD